MACSLTCSACGDSRAVPAAHPARPSVVLLSIDTLAASHTSLHGYARETTPRLEELGREAVVFERCLANASFTSPSYVSQFTGLSPGSLRADDEEFRAATGRLPELWELWRIPAGRTTLTEELASAGYRTAAFVDNPLAGRAFGLDQGFELFEVSAPGATIQKVGGGLRELTERALAWLDRLPPGQPFFLFLNALDVHSPYDPPPDLEGCFAGDALARPRAELPVSSRNNGVHGAVPSYAIHGLEGVPPPPSRVDPARITRRYDEGVRGVDEACGRLFDELRERGSWESLLLVVSADHGEAMDGPDCKFAHGTHVEDVLHVPLVMKLPGGRAAGRRVSTPVQLLDLFPTVAELCGVETPREAQGRSLVPLFDREGEGPEWILHEGGQLSSVALTAGEWRLVETRPGRASLGALLSHARGRRWLEEELPATRGRNWLVDDLRDVLRGIEDPGKAVDRAREELAGPFHELYHVPSDPDQNHDLAAEHPELVRDLVQKLGQALERSRTEHRRLPAEIDAVPAVSREELRALGYADAGD